MAEMRRSKVFPARFRGKCACCEFWFDAGDDVQFVDGELCIASHMTEEEVMKELEQLRGEVIVLREALQWITDCWGRDDSNYCRADMQGAIDNGREALASSPLSEKYAAVVMAAEAWITSSYAQDGEEYQARVRRVVDAVNALQEATK